MNRGAGIENDAVVFCDNPCKAERGVFPGCCVGVKQQEVAARIWPRSSVKEIAEVDEASGISRHIVVRSKVVTGLVGLDLDFNMIDCKRKTREVLSHIRERVHNQVAKKSTQS